jgi:hypothetical protein
MPQGGQGGQMDPRMMEMMQRLQGGMPQPAQQTGGGIERVSLDRSIPRPAGSGGMPAGGSSQAEMQYQQFLAQQQGDPPMAQRFDMAVPGGMQQTQMPPGMGPQQFLAQQQGPSGGPGQIDPQMLAAMQAFQQQGGRGGVPMTMPPTGMPQMGGGIASIDPRVGRGGSGTFVPKTVQSGQFPTVTPQSKMGQTSRAPADPRMMRGFPGF